MSLFVRADPGEAGQEADRPSPKREEAPGSNLRSIRP